MDEALHALIVANGQIAALVGARVYWKLAPQGVAAPYIVMHRISAQDHAHMQGAGGFGTYRVQIDTHGADRPQAAILARTLKQQLNGAQSGELRLIRFESERDGYTDAGIQAPFMFSQDYIVTWRPHHG